MDATTRGQSREDSLDRELEQSRLGALSRRPLLVAGLAALVFLVIAGGVIWWLYARQFEWTDDAFVDSRTVFVSPQVACLYRRVLALRRVGAGDDSTGSDVAARGYAGSTREALTVRTVLLMSYRSWDERPRPGS